MILCDIMNRNHKRLSTPSLANFLSCTEEQRMIKEITIVQWTNLKQNNSFVIPQWLSLLCEISWYTSSTTGSYDRQAGRRNPEFFLKLITAHWQAFRLSSVFNKQTALLQQYKCILSWFFWLKPICKLRKYSCLCPFKGTRALDLSLLNSQFIIHDNSNTDYKNSSYFIAYLHDLNTYIVNLFTWP